jgi:hypothetical protein
VIGVLALVLATGGALISASAATLGGVSGTGIGAGAAPVAACDADGFGVSYAVTGSTVTSATIDGIADPGCEGGTLSLTVADGTTSVGSGTATVPTDAGTADNSVTVPLSPQPPASQVTQVHVVVAGP